MADLIIGDTVDPTNCDYIKTGLYVELFQCPATTLERYVPEPHGLPPTHSFKGKLLRHDKKIDYITTLANGKINVCHQDRFCLSNKLIAMKINRIPLCPWFDGHKKIRLRIIMDYSESINPTFPDVAPTQTFDYVWSKNGMFETIITSGMCPSEIFGFTRGERPLFSQAKVKIEIIPNVDPALAPTILGTFTLLSTTWDTIYGTSVVQTSTKPCEHIPGTLDFGFVERITGGGTYWQPGWTMGWFPHGPVGLIEATQLSIFANGWGD